MIERDTYILYATNIGRAFSPEAEYEGKHYPLLASKGIFLHCYGNLDIPLEGQAPCRGSF